MQKEDLRRRNNTSANRNLNTELDLWLKFVDNDKKPLLIGTAITKGRFNDHIYELFYAPSDIAKTQPFLLNYKCGSEWDSTRFENIPQAKYYLKKNDWEAKWVKQNGKEKNN